MNPRDNTLKTIVDYVLIGVIGFIPIALVFQIVIFVERFLKDFVLLVHGRYENPLVTIVLFAAAIAFYTILAGCSSMIKRTCYTFWNHLFSEFPS